MSSIEEIKNSIKILNKNFKKNITLLHCVSSYPAVNKDLNLNIINELRKNLNVRLVIQIILLEKKHVWQR